MKELLDDGALDPKKLFDKKEYNTLVIGRDGFTTNQNNIADLLEELLEKGINRVRQEEIFIELKKANASAMLVENISKAERTDVKAKLTAASWESGLDFTDYFLFFVELAFSEDYQLAFEALTVLEYNEGNPGAEILKNAEALSNKLKSKHIILIDQLKRYIEERLEK